MKKLCVIFLLLSAMVLSGCQGLVDSPADRRRRINQIVDLQLRMMMDDIDSFLLLDRTTALTRYHLRVGT